MIHCRRSLSSILWYPFLGPSDWAPLPPEWNLAPPIPKAFLHSSSLKVKRLLLNLVGNSTLRRAWTFLQTKDENFTESRWATGKKLWLGRLHICFVLWNLLTVKLLGKEVSARDLCQVCIMLVRSELLMSNWNLIIEKGCHTESWNISRTNFWHNRCGSSRK